MLRRAVVLGVALWLSLPPALARAQTLSGAVDEATARERFQRGVVALEESRFAEAAALFEESHRLNPAPVALFNLAFAYRGLGRYLDAITSIERYLRDPANTPTDRVQAARVELDSLRAALVRVRVERSPADATLSVDGRAASERDGALVLDPGRRVIEVSRVGYRSERVERVFARGATETVRVTLPVLDRSGRLRIEPTVSRARVSIDGVFAGTGVVERELPAGEHRVSITAEGFAPLERTVRVGATGLVRVDAAMQRPRANPWPWLAPTIAGAGAVVLTVATVLALREALPPEESSSPADAWGPPLR